MGALAPIWEECISDNNLIQLNFKDTWHMPGKRSSLLDLFYCTKPELISNVENTTNLLSEHDGINLHINTKEAQLKPQFETRRSYVNVTSSNLLELLDENRNPEIQSLFNTNDPNLATEIFDNEVNKATKKLLIINKFQKKRHQCRYWNKFLEAQKKKVDYLNKFFCETKKHEDYRLLSYAKNRLTKFTKSAKKDYYKKKYNTNLGKWKELKIEEGNENKTLVSAHINNKLECSPKTLANEFSKTLLDKIQEIKSELPVNDIIAEKIYKDLVPRNENDIKLKEVTIKEIYEFINKSRPTKSRGNNEINMYILKQIPQLSAIALTHIINTIIRTGIFPDCMKISRVIPILKPKKDKNLLRSYRPINNMNVIEKVIEQVLKKQITKFIEENNILDKYMHGSRPKHSIITAKMELDEEINLHKDRGNKVAILSH